MNQLRVSIFLFCFLPLNVVAQGCDTIDRLDVATPNELFDAAVRCSDIVDASTLMIAGQIRAMTDFSTLPPKTEQDKQKTASLYGRIYWKLGGAGPYELYRSEESYTEFRRRLEAWLPTDLAAYEPGWGYRSAPPYDVYLKIIEEQKQRRLKTLDRHYLLLSNDEYYELKLEENEILRRNNNQIVKGSKDAEAVRTLSEKMGAVSARILGEN